MADRSKQRKRKRDAYRRPGRRPGSVGALGDERSQESAGDGSALDRSTARAQQKSDSEGGRPPAPWGAFPLVELVILLGILLLGGGLFMQGKQGLVMIVSGLGLGALGGTEVSIREHFAGYRSHSSLLAGVVGVIVLTVAFVVVPGGWPRAVPFAVGLVGFAGAFYLFREAFKRRSGGRGFRSR